MQVRGPRGSWPHDSGWRAPTGDVGRSRELLREERGPKHARVVLRGSVERCIPVLSAVQPSAAGFFGARVEDAPSPVCSRGAGRDGKRGEALWIVRSRYPFTRADGSGLGCPGLDPRSSLRLRTSVRPAGRHRWTSSSAGGPCASGSPAQAGEAEGGSDGASEVRRTIPAVFDMNSARRESWGRTDRRSEHLGVKPRAPDRVGMRSDLAETGAPVLCQTNRG